MSIGDWSNIPETGLGFTMICDAEPPFVFLAALESGAGVGVLLLQASRGSNHEHARGNEPGPKALVGKDHGYRRRLDVAE